MTRHALVVDDLDVTTFRRVAEVAVHVFDPDDPAHRLALELLGAIDRHDPRPRAGGDPVTDPVFRDTYGRTPRRGSTVSPFGSLPPLQQEDYP